MLGQYFCNKHNINDKIYTEENTLLHLACNHPDSFTKEKTNFYNIKFLLEKGSNPNIKNVWGTALISAAWNNHTSLETFRSLIETGKHKDGWNEFNFTQFALEYFAPDQWRKLSGLIESEIDWSYKETYSQSSILHWACADQRITLDDLRWFVTNCPDMNVLDHFRETPLFSACLNKMITPEIIKFLIVEGGNPNAKNIEDQTPYFPKGRIKDNIWMLFYYVKDAKLPKLPKPILCELARKYIIAEVETEQKPINFSKK